MSPPPAPASTAAEALCCTADDQRSTNSESETPRPTTSNGRQQVADPTSPWPKAPLSQAQQPTSQKTQPTEAHDNEESPCLGSSLPAHETDAIAEIFANAESSMELESVPTNVAEALLTTDPSHVERTPKKQKQTAGRATSMLFLRHHMRGAEAGDADGPTSKSNETDDDAISGDEATRTGRSKERGKTWGKVKRLTRDLSRSSMNLLMLKKAGDETDQEEIDKHKKKRAKLKKECSSSGSGSGPAMAGADGAGTELHVLVETSVEISVEPNLDAVGASHQANHNDRRSKDGKGDSVSPTALNYHYDSDATSLPEIRDSVVERLTRAITQEEAQREEEESLLERERTSVEIKALIEESPGKGESKFRINPFELALPRSLTFSDLRDRLSGVRLSLSDDSRPSADLSADARPDTAFLQAMKTHIAKESIAPVVRQSMAAEIENAWNESETPTSSATGSRFPGDIFRKENSQKVSSSSASSRIGSFPSSAQIDAGSGHYHASGPITYPTQPVTGHGKTQLSLLQPPKTVPRDGDAASVHLHHMRISQHLRSDSSLSSMDQHRSVKDGSEKTGPASDKFVNGTMKNSHTEGNNGKRDREGNAYPFRRLAHHNASSATNLQIPKPFAMSEDNHQQPNPNHDGHSSQVHLDIGLGTPMFPDLREVAHMPPPPPIPPSRIRGDRRTSTSSSTNASAQTGFHSSRVPPAWGHVLSNVPTQTNTTAMHSRQASGGNVSRYAGSSVYSSRYGGATGSGVGFGANGGPGATSASGKAYEPSSVYSTRANSPSLCGSLTGSGTPQPSVFSGVAESGSGTGSQSGSGVGMKKSGYEVFEMPKDLDESPDEGKDEQTVVEGVIADNSGMPGAYPPTPGPFDSVGAGQKAAGQPNDVVDVDEKEQKPERRSASTSEVSIYETPDTTAVELQNPSPEATSSPTAIMIQCPQSPPEGERTPLQSKSVKKNRSAMNLLGLQNALKPSLEHHESRRRSVGAKLSGFNIFRSKTMSNLRRASLANIVAHDSKEDAEKAPLAQNENSFEESDITDSKEFAVDGPTDRRGSAGTQALRHGVERHDRGDQRDDYDDEDEHRHHHHHHQHHHQRDSVARDMNPVPLEERKPGRLSRALAFRDSLIPVSGSANQAAVWEKALQAHREEKSALFLSPEKGGKAKAQSLFRERSGSGSALRAKAIGENEDGHKRPRSAEPTSDAWKGFAGFGERGESSKTGAKAGRSETFLLDPLDPGFRTSRVSLQPPSSGTKETSGLLGDELKHGHVPESASISPCISPAPETEETASISRTKTWNDAEVSAMNLGDLGAWSRYPSHTRDTRNNSAGLADEVRTRDFAYEIQLTEIAESDDGGDTGACNKKTSRSPKSNGGGILGAASFKRRGKNKSRGGLPKSKSMTFGRSFLKHYIGLFRSQSEEFRRHGHGHRSSIAEGGILEHPELEILPPVWSPVSIVLEPPPKESAEMGRESRGGDGADDERERDMGAKSDAKEGISSQSRDKGKQRLQDEHETGDKAMGDGAQDSFLDASDKKPDSKVDFELPEASSKPSRRDRYTGSSEASWKADARLWSKLCNSDNMSPLMTSEESLVEQKVHQAPRVDRKAERSSEWQSNARLWTRFADPSEEFNTMAQHEAESSHLLNSDFDPNDAIGLKGHMQGSSEYANRPTSPPPRTSDEWRRDARLFSQMYESCVGLPQFGSAEDVYANSISGNIAGEGRHHHAGLRVSSAGVIDSVVMGRENAHPASAAKWRTLSGGEAGACGGHFKSGSQVSSMTSLKRSTWDMMKVLD
ncbi:hypothetical protein IWZ01DRAFT_538100 [Phyllosticta capitalensis]